MDHVHHRAWHYFQERRREHLGPDDLKFPSPPEAPIKVLGANVPMEIRWWSAVLMMLAVEFFNRKTIYGKAVVATFNDRDAAKLMGINTGW
jgi:branched-chain amino acid transport system permease protein